MLLWPERDGELSPFVGWLTLTHTQRWHALRRTTGSGHLYQGRFKSFPVEADEHFLTVARYVERNALRAGLAARAEDRPWGSLGQRLHGGMEAGPVLSAGPVPWPTDWTAWVNAAPTASEEAALGRGIERGLPSGSPAWVDHSVASFSLHSTRRRIGRLVQNGSLQANGRCRTVLQTVRR